jgi:hypothetical protein
MENLNIQFQNSLVTILGLLLSLATAYAVVYLSKAIGLAKQKALAIQGDSERKLINDALDRVQKLLNTNIVAVEETIKGDMVKAVADGNISKDELNNLSIDVINKVKNQLGDGTVELLNNTLGDFDGYLEAKLEAELKKVKIENNLPSVSDIIAKAQSEVVTEPKVEEIK